MTQGNLEQTTTYDYKPSKTQPGKIDIIKEVTTYYPSGKIASKKSFLNDLKHGKWTFFYENKKKKVEEEYKFNLLTGTQTTYYENGKKQIEREYVRWKFIWRNQYLFSIGKIRRDKSLQTQ